MYNCSDKKQRKVRYQRCRRSNSQHRFLIYGTVKLTGKPFMESKGVSKMTHSSVVTQGGRPISNACRKRWHVAPSHSKLRKHTFQNTKKRKFEFEVGPGLRSYHIIILMFGLIVFFFSKFDITLFLINIRDSFWVTHLRFRLAMGVVLSSHLLINYLEIWFAYIMSTAATRPAPH